VGTVKKICVPGGKLNLKKTPPRFRDAISTKTNTVSTSPLSGMTLHQGSSLLFANVSMLKNLKKRIRDMLRMFIVHC
jgi:hypothetical protein